MYIYIYICLGGSQKERGTQERRKVGWIREAGRGAKGGPLRFGRPSIETHKANGVEKQALGLGKTSTGPSEENHKARKRKTWPDRPCPTHLFANKAPFNATPARLLLFPRFGAAPFFPRFGGAGLGFLSGGFVVGLGWPGLGLV